MVNFGLNPELLKSEEMKTRHERKQEALERQNYKCAICRHALIKHNKGQRSVGFWDHNHKTGRFRGVLCTKCNTAIGLLRDDPAFCRRAALYLLLEHASASPQ